MTESPVAWDRRTAWRQGHILTVEAASAFGLYDSVDPRSTRVVVISHDCDLANDNLDHEPEVEVIVGREVEHLNGNFMWGKAPRTLHFSYERDEQQVTIELISTRKRTVQKSALAAFSPDASLRISRQSLAVLRRWLACRYSRAAFPDTFVERMRSSKADRALVRALERRSAIVSFVYFDVDEGLSVERDENDPYRFTVYLVYPPGDDPEISADEADDLAASAEQAIRARLVGEPGLVLNGCTSISEDDIPVSRTRVLTEWRLEYMSLRDESGDGGPPR